ncbi:MAG: PEFG-CTERM sorting domain-containing protein [Thaumarchaeota archaeon]|nr:PEFG-CTERM sorting domain-containing protein [Nitrososphaerota archaeon]
MKKSIYLSFSLLAIFSLIAVAPSAFAEHGEGGMAATVTNAPGSSTPGCEETDSCFIPSTVVITVGGTVTWDNTDNAAHTSSSGTAADGPDGVFDSSLIMAGGSYSHTFDTAGTFDYFCMVHPWMQGTVIVEAEAAHGDDHAEEMEEMGHGDDHAAKGIEDLSDQFTASVSSGVIHHIGANTDDDTLIIHLFGADDDGELKITLNKDIITPFDDGSYFVLVENEEADFEQMGRTLHIEYGAGAETIEIVGSHVVPEFGTIAMIILAVAIVSIIAITAKTRISLIPRL